MILGIELLDFLSIGKSYRCCFFMLHQLSRDVLISGSGGKE